MACCRDNAQIRSDPLPRPVLRAVRIVAQKNILHLRVRHVDPLRDVTKMLYDGQSAALGLFRRP